MIPSFLHTLCLHSSPDQGQRIAGQLAARAGGSAASQQHKHSWISAVCGEALQPGVLQSLPEVEESQNGMKATTKREVLPTTTTSEHAPRTQPSRYRRKGWCPACWGCSPCRKPPRPLSGRYVWHNPQCQRTDPSSSGLTASLGPERTGSDVRPPGRWQKLPLCSLKPEDCHTYMCVPTSVT